MNCRKCGSILRRNARFCHKCGCAQIPSDVERDRKPQVGRMAKNPDDYSDRDVVSFLYDIEEKRERIRRYKNESVEEILKSEGIERPEELKKMKVSLKNIRKYIPSKMEKFSWVKFTFFAVLTKNNPDKAESLSKNVRGSISRFVFLLLGIYLLSLHITIAGLVCLAIAALFEVWNFTAWRAGRKGINERNSIVDEYYKLYPQAVAEYEETVAARANEIEVELKELSRCVSESASIENMLSARLGAKYRNLDDLKMLNAIFEDTRANTIPEAVNCLLEDKRAEEERQMAEELAREQAEYQKRMAKAAEEQARAARQAQWKQEQAEKQAKRDEQKRSLAFNEAQRRYNSALSSLKYAQTETQKKEWQERVDRAYAEMLKYK